MGAKWSGQFLFGGLLVADSLRLFAAGVGSGFLFVAFVSLVFASRSPGSG